MLENNTKRGKNPLTQYSMQQKSPQAFEYFLQYLHLKEEIVELTNRLEIQEALLKNTQPISAEGLRELVGMIKEKINLLNIYGVTTEELLFLSMNVDLTQLNEEPIMLGGNI